MSFQEFAMERWQSTWENRVGFNLSESGVHPLTAAELLSMAGGTTSPLDMRLGYPQSDGTEALRAAVAALYPRAGLDQVLVTSGSAEANYVNCWRLVQPGDARGHRAAHLHADLGPGEKLRRQRVVHSAA